MRSEVPAWEEPERWFQRCAVELDAENKQLRRRIDALTQERDDLAERCEQAWLTADAEQREALSENARLRVELDALRRLHDSCKHDDCDGQALPGLDECLWCRGCEVVNENEGESE